MNEFDPFQEASFDTSIDPLSADEMGLAILDKLDEGANLRGDDPELDAVIAENQPKLQKNLQKYQAYKVGRGEKLFSFAPEVKARKAAMGERKLAETAIKMLQADEETFESMLQESGQARQFKIEQAFMRDKDAMKGEFQTRQLLKQAGYSDREIQSGAAEPHMRGRLDAGDHEATRDAFLRWGLQKTNEFDRREKIAKSAADSAQLAYLQTGDREEFEKLLEAASPDISDEERTMVRRLGNIQYQRMEEEFSTIKPLVRKTFNTIMAEEGINSQLSTEGEGFETIEDAIAAMGEVPREDFDKLLMALSKTAEANGEDVDGFFNKLGKNFTRASEQLFKGALRPGLNQTATSQLEDLDILIAGGEIKSSGAPYSYPLELVGEKGNVVGYESVNAFGDTNGLRGRITPERAADTFNRQAQNNERGGVTARAITDPEGLEAARESLQKRKNSLDYASEIYNWRDAVAKVGSDNLFVNDWVYGTARSLPEMGAAATGIPGLLLVASAQKERDMAEIRRRKPDANWEDYEGATTASGFIYSALNRAQFKTATRKLPLTRKFTLEAGRRILAEGIQESAQDITLAATLELYGALGADIESFDLGTEALEVAKRFPRTMFAVAPLAVGGMMGRGALDYIDMKSYERMINDADLMQAYGIDPTEQSHIRSLPVVEGLDYIRDNNEFFLGNIEGTFDVEVLGQEQFQTDGEQRLGDIPTFDTPQGTFTFELTPKERELLPDEQEAANYEQWKAEQGEDTQAGTTPLGAVLEDSYGKYLDEQLREAIGLAEVEAEINERIKELEAPPRNPIREDVDNVFSTQLKDILEESYGKAIEDDFRKAIGVDQAEADPNKEATLRANIAASLRKELSNIDAESNTAAVNRAKAQIALREKLAEAEPQKAPQVEPVEDFSVRFIAQADGTFSVTNGEQTVKARSPEEATEAAVQISPKVLGRRKASTPTITSRDELARARNQSQNPITVNSSVTDTFTGKNPLETWGSTLDPTIEPTSPLGHPEVTRALVRVLESVGVKGGVRAAGAKKLGDGVLGTYNTQTGVLRIATHGDITTAAHEISHSIQDQYLYPGKPFSDTNFLDDKDVSDTVITELKDIATKHYAGGNAEVIAELNTQGVIVSEGFAEYIRLRMQGENIKSSATDKWFDDKVLAPNPQLAKAFTRAARLVKQYDDQGSKRRAEGNVNFGKTPAQRFADAAKVDPQEVITKMVESLNPIKQIVKAAEQAADGKLPDTLNPYLIGKRLRYTHSAITAQMVEVGMQDFNGNYKGANTSLKHALRGITTAERSDFTIYLWARRALSLAQRNINAGITLADANKIFNELHSSRFENAANLVYEWNDNVLEYAAQSSQDFAEVVSRIRAGDAGNYIPLQREFESFRKAYAGGGSGSVNGAQLVKKLKGSGRRIKDPLQSMTSNAEKIILKAHERRVVESLIRLKEFAPKIGFVIDEVPVGKLPMAMKGAADTASEVANALEGELSDAAAELAEMIGDSDQANNMVTFWGEAYNPPNKLENPVIPIFIDGKRRFYEVDRNAYEALEGLDMYRPDSRAMKAASFTTRSWRAGTTGFNATFQLVTNPQRDFRTLAQQTRSEAGMARVWATWQRSQFEGAIEGLSGNHIQTEWSKLFNQLGLEMTTPLGQDANYTRMATKNLFSANGKTQKALRVLSPSNVGKYVMDVIQFSEKATRVAELKLVARDLGFDPAKDELTPEIAQSLALAAREVTTDFSASGSVGKTLNQVIPFWNAQIQGVRAHVRSYNTSAAKLDDKGRAHQLLFNRFMARGYAMSGISITLWLMNRDEDWWREMPESEKYTHSYIPVPASVSPTGMDELVKIPKAFELDGFFMGAPVAMLDSFYQENPQLAVEFAERFLVSSIPNHPVIINYLLEREGKEDYFGRPVIPMQEEVLDVDGERYRQFGPRTTKVAKKFGEIFDVSPRRVDHTVKSFFGRGGIDALSIFGVSESDIREPHATRFPVLGSILHPKGQSPYSPKSITDFYDMRTVLAAQASKVNQESPETKESREMRLAFNDASDAMTLVREVRKVTSDEATIRELQQLELEIAKDAVEMFNASEPNRKQFKQWKKTVKDLES